MTVEEALEILRDLEVPDDQMVSLNKVVVYIEEGRLDEAKTFLLKRLNRPEAAVYRTEILERLVKVHEAMIEKSREAVKKRVLQEETLGYLQELLRQTRNPFCYYRIGRQQMMMGDTTAASESFAAAYEKLPENSLYREPARKLAEKLSKP